MKRPLLDSGPITYCCVPTELVRKMSTSKTDRKPKPKPEIGFSYPRALKRVFRIVATSQLFRFYRSGAPHDHRFEMNFHFIPRYEVPGGEFIFVFKEHFSVFSFLSKSFSFINWIGMLNDPPISQSRRSVPD